MSAFLLAACKSGDATDPIATVDKLQLNAAQIHALDSTGQVIVQTNPANGDLRSLVDSTLLVLTAGIEAKRVDIATNLTSAPLYFVGIHRAVARTGGSFSTWTLVGFDDPARLANLIEVSGFAQTASNTAPTALTGTIGDGTGAVNGMLLQVAAGGVVTQWRANVGAVSFSSEAPGIACPGFTPTSKVTCTVETMHVHFTMTGVVSTGSGGTRQATLANDAAVPTMRLNYTP